jgi:hypothetical protein
MLNQAKVQDINLWEAWVEYDQFNPEYFGMLYVIGEIMSDQPEELLIRKNEQSQGRELVLTIPAFESRGRARMREARFSEPIQNLNQYASISIYSAGELLVKIEEIEVLV